MVRALCFHCWGTKIPRHTRCPPTPKNLLKKNSIVQLEKTEIKYWKYKYKTNHTQKYKSTNCGCKYRGSIAAGITVDVCTTHYVLATAKSYTYMILFNPHFYPVKWGRWDYNYSHFTFAEMKRVHPFPKVPASIRERIQNQCYPELTWVHLKWKRGFISQVWALKQESLGIVWRRSLGARGFMHRKRPRGGICDDQNHKHFLRTF